MFEQNTRLFIQWFHRDELNELSAAIYFNEDNGRYNDVLDWWGTEEEESRPRFLFEDYDYTYLPAGRIGTYQQVVQILDGVKSFTVDYYPGNVSDEKISFDMTIE